MIYFIQGSCACFYYKTAVADINSLKFAVPFSEQQLVTGTYKLIVCFLTASITCTHFFCGTVITSWEHLRRSVISSRPYLLREKFKGILRKFEKSNGSPIFLNVLVYSTEQQSWS